MYFSSLKYALALLGLAAPERLVVPPIFEDFEAPSALRLYPIPARGGLRSQWRIETLVPAGELGPGPITLLALGLRADQDDPGASRELRGSITLSTQPRDELRNRFAENAGDAPVTFFVHGRRNGGRRAKGPPAWHFDLPGGFRFDPAREGNLHVRLDIEAPDDAVLDAAPALKPRLLSASDLLAAGGDLRPETLVLLLTLERDPAAFGPGLVSAPPLAPAPARPAPAVPKRREMPAEPGRDELVARVRALDQRIGELEQALARATETSERLAARIEREVRSATALLARHYVETALASGRPVPGWLRSPEGPAGLDTGRRVVLEAIQAARNNGFDVHPAEGHLAEGDRHGAGGQPSLAFLSYSLAFRSVLARFRPFETGPPPAPARPAGPIAAGRSLEGRAPYIVSDYPVW